MEASHCLHGWVIAAAVLGVGLPANAQDGERPLSLQDAVRSAVAGSPDLDVADLAVRASRAREAAARGAWMPTPYVDAGYAGATTPTTAPNVDADLSYGERTLSFGAGLNGSLPSGTTYQLAVTGSRYVSDARVADGSGTRFLNALRPTFNTRIQLVLSQPLLRGAWGVANAPTDVARLEGDALVARRESLENDLALAVVGAYWQLTVAQASERVAGESVALAERQFTATKARIAAGRLSPLDETSARASVAARQDAAVAAQQARIAAEAALVSLVVDDAPSGRQLAAALRATSEPPAPGDLGQPASIEAETRRALSRRPELRELRARVAAAHRTQEAADHETLPDLSLTATVGLRGLAGDKQRPPGGVEDTLGEHFDGGIGQSFANGPRFPYYTIGAHLEMPLPNTQATALAEAAAIDARARAAELRRAEWVVRTQVRQAVRVLAQARERLRTASEALTLAQQSLEGEQRKFDAGVSTTFEVIRVQESLASAQTAQFSALANHAVAVAELSHRRGTLLEDLGVTRRSPSGSR